MADDKNSNRMMLEIDRAIRAINRQIINPEIPEISLGDLSPVLKLVAKSRAAYLKELFDIANLSEDMPSVEQIKHLNNLRLTFEELVLATKALQTAIERGYLDIRQ